MCLGGLVGGPMPGLLCAVESLLQKPAHFLQTFLLLLVTWVTECFPTHHSFVRLLAH